MDKQLLLAVEQCFFIYQSIPVDLGQKSVILLVKQISIFIIAVYRVFNIEFPF